MTGTRMSLGFVAGRSRCVGRGHSMEIRARGWSAASDPRSAEPGSARRERTGHGGEGRD